MTETVDELTPETGGVWLVTTQGSTHVWDLDNMTYERRPGSESKAGPFVLDGEPQRITKVYIWPKVGERSFVWYDDPDDPLFMEQFRISSRIDKIERVKPEEGS